MAKNNEKTVYTIVSEGSIIGVYTNIKELYTKLTNIWDSEDYEPLPTYQQLLKLRKKDMDNNYMFSYSVESLSDYIGCYTIKEVYLNN